MTAAERNPMEKSLKIAIAFAMLAESGLAVKKKEREWKMIDLVEGTADK